MADLDVSSAAGAGLSLIRRRPAAVLAWGVATGIFLLLALLALAPVFGMVLERIRHPIVGPPDFGALARFQASSMLVNIGSLFLRAVIMCAVFRAVLEPEEAAFGYMRISMSELFMAVLIFGGSIAVVLMMLIVALPFILCVVWLAATHNVAAAVMVGVVGVLIIAALGVWLALRLSLLGPMIVASREFPLGEAWSLTRGRAGSLLLIALMIVLIILALELVAFAATGIVGFGLLSAVPHDQADLRRFFYRPMGDLLAGLAPILILAWIVWSLLAGVVMAIGYAPWAEAYRQLAPPRQPGAIV